MDSMDIIRDAAPGCTRKHLIQMLTVYLSMSTRADVEWSQSFLEKVFMFDDLRSDELGLDENKDAIKLLRGLCGFIENGSSTSVSISQDEATKTWIVTPDGGKYGYGDSLIEAIKVAAQNNPFKY